MLDRPDVVGVVCVSRRIQASLPLPTQHEIDTLAVTCSVVGVDSLSNLAVVAFHCVMLYVPYTEVGGFGCLLSRLLFFQSGNLSLAVLYHQLPTLPTVRPLELIVHANSSLSETAQIVPFASNAQYHTVSGGCFSVTHTRSYHSVPYVAECLEDSICLCPVASSECVICIAARPLADRTPSIHLMKVARIRVPQATNSLSSLRTRSHQRASIEYLRWWAVC